MEKTQKNVLFGIIIFLVCSSILSCEAFRFNVMKEDNLGTETINVDLACNSWKNCVAYCGSKAPFCIFGKCDCGSGPPGPRI
nr:hypothetical protein Iba_scaffold14897CG0520 [Ipomoea batatas]